MEKRQFFHNCDDKIINKLFSYLNIKTITTLLLINKEISKFVLKNENFIKFLKIKKEFCDNKDDQFNKKPKKINTLGIRLQQAKTSLNKKQNVIQSNQNNVSNNKSTDNKISKKEKINFELVNIELLVKNDAEKIKKLANKYSLSKEETLSIFSGLIESKLIRQFFQNPKKECQIKASPLGIGSIYLQNALSSFSDIVKLDFSGNQISNKNFTPLSNLIAISNSLLILNLSDNKINDSCCKQLFQGLENNKVINYLNLSKNEISSEGIIFANSFLSFTNSLNTLNFEQNLLGANGIGFLSDFLENNTSIRTLNIAYNGIQEEGVKRIKGTLQKNTKIISLFIGGNYICDNGIKELVDILKEGSKISYLFLETNNISSKGAEYITKIAMFHPFITSLNLKNNNLNDEGVIQIFKSLQHESKLISLDLTNNNLTYKSIQVIASSLEKNKTLGSLILNKNKIGKEGCKYIAQLIEKNNSLINLSLVKCEIEKGIDIILEKLGHNKKISVIDLSRNSLGNNSQLFLSFIPCLKENKTLNEIIIDEAELNDTDVKVLCAGLCDNHTIKKVSLNKNQFTNKILFDILNAITKSRSIKYFDIDKSDFSLIDKKEIEMALKKNFQLRK